MAVFKCKMCGGDLEISAGLSIAECEYCGTKQTVPTKMDENLQGLFNRANTLRLKCEFDKAEKLYEKIVQADINQSEAYWGLILCKYGIEYVDDPKTFKKIPTCHRASFDSVVADDDFKSAIANADSQQRVLYEEQAKEIDRIQKEILALAQKEESYDVFICYKETDSDGKRTQDSVIANDIYYQLTQEGFKVFYAAITLEGKLGSAYEPIIFSALNSAKVMLVLGTKPEYFNAVWVKNEWSRFLKIVSNDRSKLLIPCYRDMDAYELPEEFAHLQAQDMGKIGFINDVVRGIKKVSVKEDKQEVIKETVITGNANVEPLLVRAFMFLEDGDWQKADEFCEQVLNLEPKNAKAYLGKLMADLKIKKQEDLKNLEVSFEENSNYQKTIRFADEKLKNELEECIDFINARNENARLEGLYVQAVNYYNNARTFEHFQQATKMFSEIKHYKDSEEYILKSAEDIYKNGVSLMNSASSELSMMQASKAFECIPDYKDANELYEQCVEKAKELHNTAIYEIAMKKLNLHSIIFVKKGLAELKEISGWRNVDEQIQAFEKRIKELEAQEEHFLIAAENKNKRDKMILFAVGGILAFIFIFLIVIAYMNGLN